MRDFLLFHLLFHLIIILSTSRWSHGFIIIPTTKSHRARSFTRTGSLVHHAVATTNTADVNVNDDLIISRTKSWVESMVIGLELCPFAERVVRAGSVLYIVSHAQDPEAVLTDVISEALRLLTR